MLFSYGVCVNDTKMILFVENSVRKRLFSTENDGIIIGEKLLVGLVAIPGSTKQWVRHPLFIG